MFDSSFCGVFAAVVTVGSMELAKPAIEKKKQYTQHQR